MCELARKEDLPLYTYFGVQTSIPLSPERGSLIFILNQRRGELHRVEAICSGQAVHELVELGFELGAVSAKALDLGEKGEFGGAHHPVSSFKNCGEWRGLYHD